MEKAEKRICYCDKHFVPILLNNIPEQDYTKALKQLLSKTMIDFAKRAKKYMVCYYITKITSFVAPLIITLLTTLEIVHAETYTVVLSLVASLAVGIAGIGMFHESWIRYRDHFEQLMFEVVKYSCGDSEYSEAEDKKRFNLLSTKVLTILYAEKDQWKKAATTEFNGINLKGLSRTQQNQLLEVINKTLENQIASE